MSPYSFAKSFYKMTLIEYSGFSGLFAKVILSKINDIEGFKDKFF